MKDDRTIDPELLFERRKATGEPQPFYFLVGGNRFILGPRYIDHKSFISRLELRYYRPQGKGHCSLDIEGRTLMIWDNYFKAWAWGLRNDMKVKSTLAVDE